MVYLITISRLAGKRNFLAPAMKISVRLALLTGIILPVIEVIRRWHQLLDLHYFFAWFDDFLIGGFLLFAVWKVNVSAVNGQRFLTAAWGFATGMAYASFFIQFINQSLPDPSGLPVKAVLAFKFAGLILCMTGLLLSLKNIKTENEIN